MKFSSKFTISKVVSFPKPNYMCHNFTIVLFKLINISLIACSFQPRLGRLGQISWLSLLADHQSLTSRRRTSSLLLLLTFNAQRFFCSQVAGLSFTGMSDKTCNLPFSVSHVEGKGRVAVAARQIKVHAFLELVSYLTITFIMTICIIFIKSVTHDIGSMTLFQETCWALFLDKYHDL